MGNCISELSVENLQKYIEEDLKEDLNIRYLFSLCNNIEQLSNQAVCQIPINKLPPEYKFEKESKYHDVVIQIIPKTTEEESKKLKEILLSFLSKLYSFSNENQKEFTIQVKKVFSPNQPPKLKKNESVKFTIDPETKEIIQVKEIKDIVEKFELKKLKRIIDEQILSKNSNLPTLYNFYEGKFGFYLIYEYQPHSLDSILKFSKKLIDSSPTKRKFVFYQLHKFIEHCHAKGISHGYLTPNSILVNEYFWIFITHFQLNEINETKKENKLKNNEELKSKFTLKQSSIDLSQVKFDSKSIFYEGEKVIIPRSSGGYSFGRILGISKKNGWKVLISTDNDEYAWKDLLESSIGKIPSTIALDGIQSFIMLWTRGEITNFDYLMILNSLAGRRKGDWQYAPIFPWVIDFKGPKKNWRDLTKTKYRLTKGDQMLDFTYHSPEPHHITEFLSEITFFIYLARRTPVDFLKKYVRSNFEPREYPTSVERLYEWSPDELIPEFYSDPTIFKSIHKDMPDLEVPSWCTGPEDFIKQHRDLLESDYVSRNLHHWIDLTFGYKLRGEAAVNAMNVQLEPDTKSPNRTGFVQLFKYPHPKRICSRNEQEKLDSSFQRRDTFTSRSTKDLNRISGTQQQLQIQNLKGTDSKRQWSNLFRQEGGKDSLIPLPSQIISNLHFLSPLQSYEQTMKFSSTYYGRSEYHIVDLLKKNHLQEIFTQDELFADDLFSLGCILAEMYTFKPLFTTQKLMAYVERSKNINHSIVEDIPFQARAIVASLISLKYPKKTNSLEWKRFFPNYFESVFNFLSGFYSFLNSKDKIQYFEENEEFILQLPMDGFELVFSHVIGMIIESKSLWENGIKLLAKSEYLGDKIFESDELKQLISKFIRDCYDSGSENENLQMILYSSSIAKLSHKIAIEPKIFLEQILPYFIDALSSNSEKISKISSETIYHLCLNDLSTHFTLTHIIDPIFIRLNRKINYTNDMNVKYLYKTLLNVGHKMGCASLNYFLPKIFDIIIESLQQGIDSYQMLNFLNGILNILSSSKVTLALELSTQKIVNIFKNSLKFSIDSFEKFSQIFSFLFTVCEIRVRVELIRSCIPSLTMIFRTNVNIPKDILTDIISANKIDEEELFEKIENGRGSTVNLVSLLENEEDLIQQEPYSEIDFLKCCMMYKMLCCVLGNSAMRDAISTSKIYEDELQANTTINSPSENSKNDDLFKLDFEQNFDNYSSSNSSDCWVMSQNSKIKNIFRGVLETEFVSNQLDSNFKIFDISKDEKYFLTGSKQNLKLWEFDHGKYIYNINTSKEVTKTVFWDKKCSSIVSCAQSIIMTDTETGNNINVLKNSFNTFTPTHDPNLILTATNDGSLKFYDFRSNKETCDWKIGLHLYALPLRPSIRSLCYHPNSDFVSIGLSTGVICNLEKYSGFLLDMFSAHSKEVCDIVPYGPNQFFSWTKSRKEDKNPVSLWNLSSSSPQMITAYSGILDPLIDVDLKDDQIFGISNNFIYKANTKFPEKNTPFDAYKPSLKKNVSFTGVKYMPLHEYLITSTDEGKLKVYS